MITLHQQQLRQALTHAISFITVFLDLLLGRGWVARAPPNACEDACLGPDVNVLLFSWSQDEALLLELLRKCESINQGRIDRIQATEVTIFIR